MQLCLKSFLFVKFSSFMLMLLPACNFLVLVFLVVCNRVVLCSSSYVG